LWNWSPDYTTALGGIEGQGAGVITLSSGPLQVCPEVPGGGLAAHLSLDGERDYSSAWYYLADGRIAQTDGDDGSVYVIDGRCDSPEWSRLLQP